MESFHDYTLATPWERFVAVIEQNFRSWLLTGLDGLPKTRPGSKPSTHKIQAKLSHKLPWRREPYLLTLYVPPVDSGASGVKRTHSIRKTDHSSAHTNPSPDHDAAHKAAKASTPQEKGNQPVDRSTVMSAHAASASPKLPPLFPAAARRLSTESADAPGGQVPTATGTTPAQGSAPLHSLQSEEVFLDVEEDSDNDELDPADMDRLLSDMRNTDLQLHMLSPRESVIDTASVAASEAPPVPDDAPPSLSVSDDADADEPAVLTTVPIHITDERSATEARNRASQGRGVMKESRSWWPLRGRPRQWWRYGKQHRLQTWFGVDIFLLLEPASYSGRILNEKEANALLSALAVALHNTSISWPAFIPVHDALRDTFWGTAATCFGPVRFDTDSIHTSRTPQYLSGLEGQLSLFAAQLRPYSPGASLYCQALANPYAIDCPSQQYEPCNVTLTCRQVYALPMAGMDEDDSGEEDSSWSSRWDDFAPWRPWASQKDPINLLELDVVWENVALQLGRQSLELHPKEAHHWILQVLQCGVSTPTKAKGFMPRSVDRCRQHVQLQREGSDWLWSAGNASFYFHNSLISERQQQAAENAVDVGLSSFTAMLHALLSSRGAAGRASSMGEMVHAEWWEQRNAVVPPSPPERVMEDVLRDLFNPVRPPTLFRRSNPQPSMPLDFPGTAPHDCLLGSLAKHCLVFGNARAIAMLWSRFIQQVRFSYWDNVTLLPRLPARLATTQPPPAPTSPASNLHTPTKLPSIQRREQITPPNPIHGHETPKPVDTASQPLTPRSSTPVMEGRGDSGVSGRGNADCASGPGSPQRMSSSLPPVDVPSAVRRTGSAPVTPVVGSRTAWSVSALEELRWELTGGELGFARNGMLGGPPEPDLNSCLLHQKLQLLNVCIFRRNAQQSSRRAANRQQQGGNTDGWDFDSDEEFTDAAPANSVTTSSVAGSEYESCSDGEDSVHSMKQTHSLPSPSRLNASSCPTCVPDTQEPPCLTADMLLAKQRLLSALMHKAADNQDLLLKLKAELLISDIAAFKDANPGCSVQDFMAWQQAVGAQGSALHNDHTGLATTNSHTTTTLPPIRSSSLPHQDSPTTRSPHQQDHTPSPLQSKPRPCAPAQEVNETFTSGGSPLAPTTSLPSHNETVATGGKHSTPTTSLPSCGPHSIPGPKQTDVLLGLWQATPPCAADRQKPLFDVEREAETVLHYLETIPPVSLFNQLFVVGLACAVRLLSLCKGARLEVCRRKLEQFASIMAPILEKGSGLAEALEELEGKTGGAGGRESGGRASSGRPRGLDDAELEFVLAEFQVLEQVVVLAESLSRRLPNSPALCNRILERMVEGSDEGENEPEERFWSGCMVVTEEEREVVWKALTKRLKHGRSDAGGSTSPAWGSNPQAENSWPSPPRAEDAEHPAAVQQEWVLECTMEHPRRCRPQRPVAHFDASGVHPPRCKHRLYVQQADSEMRLATLFTNHGP